ncbi:MAG TPA: hypothetical protein VMM38_01495 [Aridibacter sp.]|nr:hypothetical protein [Aridibacter sp.]
MANKLGKNSVAEIREAVRRCTNSNEISAEVERLAEHFGISKSRIYEITRDIRPKRKRRRDAGIKTADLMEHKGLKLAASWVVTHHIDPAEALRTAEERGYEIPVELTTFQRYMREKGLNRKNRRMNKKTYRRFEAKAPGDVFQFDISGSKQRWFDTKTRRIVQVSELEVSKNHPNEKKTRTRVWRFVLTDDHSRMRFIRFVTCDKPNSSHVLGFLLEAYQELGVPKILYTDNDAVIKFGRNQRASQILDKALEETGGYKLLQHLPGNSRATGKVEVAHQHVEKLEKLLGLFLAEGREITLDVLNRFGEQMCGEWNNTANRATSESPISRWNAQRHLIRKVDAAVLRSAFLVDEFTVTINGDLTIRHKGTVWQLPTDQHFENLVHRQSKQNRVRIVFPDDADFFTLIDFEGNEYDIVKVEAAPDEFGEFKSTPDDVAERTRKELQAYAKENAKREKELNRAGYTPKPIAVIDTVYEAPVTNVARFPQPEADVTEKVLEAAPGARPSEGYSGHLISFWDAVRKYEHKFSSKAECKAFLDSCFESREEDQPETPIREAIDALGAGAPRLRVAK